MRKWLLSSIYILIILITISLFLTLLFSFLTENKCRQLVETINTTTIWNAKITNYQRGWFKANATVQISLDKLNLPHQELYQLAITADISHGPIFIDWKRFQFVQALINANINLNTIQNSWFKRDIQTKPIANIKTKFKLNGDVDISLNSQPFSYQDQENSIDWYGLKIRSIFSPLYDQVKSNIEFTGFDIKTNDFILHIGEIISVYQGNKTKEGVWLGERNLQIVSVSTTNANKRTIFFGNLDLHNLITGDKNNTANIATNITINNLNINGAVYNQNKLDLEINNIKQSLLAKLLQQLTSNKILSSPKSILFDTIIAILNNGSEINIKQLNTNTPWGKLFTTIKVAFANQPGNVGLFATITNSTIDTTIKAEPALVLHLLEKFYKNIPLKKPTNPAKQAASLLKEWQESGKVLTSNNDNYLYLNFNYKNNQPLINNKQLILTTIP